MVRPPASRRWLALAAALSVLALVAIRYDLAPWLRGPAPYPPEWQWRYRPHALAKALPLLPIGAGLVALLAASGSAVAARRPRRAAAAVLAAGTLLGLAFPLALLSTEDGGAVAFLVSRTSSPAYLSYHAVARSPVAADTGAFLRQYPDLLPGLPEHAATHPPGPVLLFKALIAGLERAHRIETILRVRVDRACALDGSRCSAAVAAQSPVERSAALAGALVAHGLAVLALWPLAWLAFAQNRDPLAAARVAVLWPFVPGAALFIPELDPMLALPVVGALAATRLGLCGARRWTRLLGAVVAGACVAAAMLLSYGALLLLPLGLVMIVASLPRYALTRTRLLTALAGGALALTAVMALPMWHGYDPLRSALVAIQIHRSALTAHRSYPLWLLFGPLDFALFLGVPLTVGLGAHALRAARARSTTPPDRFTLAFVGALAVLILSGFVRGEVGRILVPWMPLALLGGLLRLDDEPGPDAFTASVTAALLVCFDIVMRLSWRI